MAYISDHTKDALRRAPHGGTICDIGSVLVASSSLFAHAAASHDLSFRRKQCRRNDFVNYENQGVTGVHSLNDTTRYMYSLSSVVGVPSSAKVLIIHRAR